MLPTTSKNTDTIINADSDQNNNVNIPINNTVSNVLGNEVYAANLINQILNNITNIDELIKKNLKDF